jgi:preprotein translocase subunit YajC
MDGWMEYGGALALSLFLLGGVFLYFLCRRERKSKRRFDMCFSF